jgi:hypothetical protein
MEHAGYAILSIAYGVPHFETSQRRRNRQAQESYLCTEMLGTDGR